MSTASSRDLELWKKWKEERNKDNLTPLMASMNPVIQKEVSRWATGNVSRPVLNIEAKKIALKAFDSYDPNSTQLNTHLTNQLKGLSRIVYTHSNAARMPEHQTLKVGSYLNAKNELEEDLGREPTAQELSASLKWSMKEVDRFRNELRSGLSTSKPTPPGFETYNPDEAFIDFVYNDLHDQDKLVFEHTTGYGGNKILSAKTLMAKTGMTQGQISHSKRRITKMVLEMKGLK
jgi:hypothetical protein